MRYGTGNSQTSIPPEGSLSRRDFFKKSAAAAVGATMLGAGFSSALAEKELTVNGLPAVVLGRTGLKVTRISFGGILITEPPVLLRAIDQGINFIHTAPGYTNGRSIEAFGKAMKTHRKKVVLALKERPENLDAALKQLNTDYVDILVPPMHDLSSINFPTVKASFEKAKKAGKCGFMGFSCHNNMAAVLDRARELGYYDVVLLGYSNAGDPQFLEAAGKAVEAGIGIMAMKGLPKRGSDGSMPEEAALATSRCTSMLAREHAHTVLASMGSFQSVDFYHGVLETKLGLFSPRLEENYWAMQDGNYCSMCGKCTGICPQGVEIRRIVRYRMYQRDYGLNDYARSRYAALAPGCGAENCDRCGLCEKVCTRGLPLTAMLGEANRLLA